MVVTDFKVKGLESTSQHDVTSIYVGRSHFSPNLVADLKAARDEYIKDINISLFFNFPVQISNLVSVVINLLLMCVSLLLYHSQCFTVIKHFLAITFSFSLDTLNLILDLL